MAPRLLSQWWAITRYAITFVASIPNTMVVRLDMVMDRTACGVRDVSVLSPSTKALDSA
ncbi:hypothetical protein MMC07_004227 [Pseudocyphellaria aurata]|nr:hypothetical protein [Pseudocyphellaria aurata]